MKNTLSYSSLIMMAADGAASGAGGSPVYFTKEINPKGLKAAYDVLKWTPSGKLAVKVSTGEPPKSNYLRPELIGELVKSLNGVIVECNTAYGGSRVDTENHKKVARDHGFTQFAEVDIQDEDGSMTLPIVGGEVLKENYVGTHFVNYGSYLVLSHFKGHIMGGFGGAVKNISIGIGSSKGKCWIHTGGTSLTTMTGGVQDAFLKSMAEAGKSVSDALGQGKKIVYVNVMNRLSIDCDCMGEPAEPEIADIGILSSTDPVALDQACIDLVWKAEGAKSFIERVENKNGLLTLAHAEKLGLGSRKYQLINL